VSDQGISRRQIARGELVDFDQTPALHPAVIRKISKTTVNALVAVHESDANTIVAVHRERNRAVWLGERLQTVEDTTANVIDAIGAQGEKLRYFADKVDGMSFNLMCEAHRRGAIEGMGLITEAGQ